METQLNRIETVCFVAETANNSKLHNRTINKLKPTLEQLSEQMGVSPMQCLWVSVLYVLSFKNNTVDLSDLSHYLACDIVKIIPHLPDFEVLIKRKIIAQKGHTYYDAKSNHDFILPKETIDRIAKGQALENMEVVKKELEVFEFLEQLNELLESTGNKEIDLIHALNLIEQHSTIPFVSRSKKLLVDFFDLILFFMVSWETMMGREYTLLNEVLKKLYNSKSTQFKELQGFINKRNDLIKLNLLDIKPERFYVDVNVSLTEKSLSFLEEAGLKVIDLSFDKKDFIEPKDIKKKKLLFNEPEQKQFNLIESSLKPTEFKKIQARLESKGLPKGLSVLLHGHPGTGKTETVLQMAKATGRPLLKVDISETKSAWFGESQKIIKQIFTKYNRLMKKSKLCPILFINEADALFSKRKDADFSKVSQTENEIQNILLEEMEKFEGILFATTNIIDNFDTAFDRRFLFKLCLPKPDQALREGLWQLKVKKLKASDYTLLASRYEFSGGEIDNIIRKIEISDILYQQKIDLETIIQFCEEETMRRNGAGRNKVGF
jgi:AAA+ superfamily predicted ATPase